MCFEYQEIKFPPPYRPPDRKQRWKFWSVFIEIWFFDTQNTFYLIVRDLKNAFFMPFAPLLYRYLTIFDRAAASRKEELGIV